MLGVPLEEIALLAAAIVGGEVVTGLLAGLFGIGGGAIIVPVLYEIFRAFGAPEEVRMQLCVGTSLAIIVPTSIRSFLSHRARGNLPRGAAAVGPADPGGDRRRGGIAALAPAWVFNSRCTIVTGLIAIRLFFGNESWRLGDACPAGSRWPATASSSGSTRP